jgi:hypothetical protein
MGDEQKNDSTYDAETGDPLLTNKVLIARGIKDFGTTIYVGTRDEWAISFYGDLHDWYEEYIDKERESKEWQIKHRDYEYEAPTFDEWLEPVLSDLAKATEEDVATYGRLGQPKKQGALSSLKQAIQLLGSNRQKPPDFNPGRMSINSTSED